MKVKQWLASSLAVLMLVSTVGCGDNSSSSKAESNKLVLLHTILIKSV